VVIKVRLHSRARLDLAEIRDFIRQAYGPESAERIRLHLKSRIERLGRSPPVGIASDLLGIRILSPTRYPYRIYFTRTDTAVSVLHIRHTSRKLAKAEDLS
jgi:toxin ParE1/3/4